MSWYRMYCIVRKTFAAFGFLIFCGVIVFLVATAWKTPIHQFNLWTLKKNFEMLATFHPNNSTPVLTFKRFGGLFSSVANSCDYFVGEFRTSTSSKEEIRLQYRDLFVKASRGSAQLSVQVRFADEDEFWIYYPWSELYGELLHLLQRFPSEQDGMYVVFASQTVYPPYADFRCW